MENQFSNFCIETFNSFQFCSKNDKENELFFAKQAVKHFSSSDSCRRNISNFVCLSVGAQSFDLCCSQLVLTSIEWRGKAAFRNKQTCLWGVLQENSPLSAPGRLWGGSQAPSGGRFLYFTSFLTEKLMFCAQICLKFVGFGLY